MLYYFVKKLPVTNPALAFRTNRSDPAWLGHIPAAMRGTKSPHFILIREWAIRIAGSNEPPPPGQLVKV